MYKIFLRLLLAFMPFTLLNAQAPLTHIAVDFGYEGINEDDRIGQMMFTFKHFWVYGDEQFQVVKMYSMPDRPNTMDGIVTEIVKNLSDNKTYICMTIGDKKVKLEASAEDQAASVERIFGSFVDTSFTFVPDTASKLQIAGQHCQKVQLKPSDPDMITPVIYLNTLEPADALVKKLPIYVVREGVIAGLCLGTDKPFGENTYQLRAQQIDTSNKIDYAARLASFTTSDKSELNKIIKAYIGM